jgi:hypothetical protein
MGRMCDLDIELRDGLTNLTKEEFITMFGEKRYDEYRRKVNDENTRIESSAEQRRE